MMDDQQFNALLGRAVQELREKQQLLDEEYDLGKYSRWWFDQETATLEFYDAQDKVGLVADLVDIGSYSTRSGTWKWGWSNESVLPSLRQHAEKLKELRAITGMDLFGWEDPFKVDAESAWELAAIAVMHLSALGCYRAPTSDGELLMFLALSALHIAN
jgi:hypothetical protein